jgi:signal transduction histidine kinase
MQAVAALAEEARHLGRQLEATLAKHPQQAALLGQIDEIVAGLAAVDDELRELTRPLEVSRTPHRSLRATLQREVAALRAAGIATSIVERGSFRWLTNSQRIALVRVVQEALANVRRHSGATSVRVTVTADGGRVHGEIVDDGCGFDPEAALAAASRRNRLGLIGMGERVRLLGGVFEIESTANAGPTRIFFDLPEWRPLDEARAAG